MHELSPQRFIDRRIDLNHDPKFPILLDSFFLHQSLSQRYPDMTNFNESISDRQQSFHQQLKLAILQDTEGECGNERDGMGKISHSMLRRFLRGLQLN